MKFQRDWDEVSAQGPGMAAELFIDPGEDRLPPHVVPVDLDPSLGVQKVFFQEERPFCVVMAMTR